MVQVRDFRNRLFDGGWCVVTYPSPDRSVSASLGDNVGEITFLATSPEEMIDQLRDLVDSAREVIAYLEEQDQ